MTRDISDDLLAQVRAKISDAYYEARNNHQTMEEAANAAVAALKPILASVDENAHRRGMVLGGAWGASLATDGLTMEWDDDHTFAFTEDENCNITGYGHQDPAAFAQLVNDYDAVCNGDELAEDDLWTSDHIAHRWVTIDPEDDERMLPVEPGTPGAIPVTTLWGQR